MQLENVIRGTAVAVVLLALAVAAGAQTTQPTTQPASRPTERAHVVKRGTLSLDVQVEGTLQPVDPYEVKLKLKGYQGALEVVSAAAHGASVKKGEVLLELDPREIKWAIEGAEGALAAARAGLKKAQSDVELGEKSDAFALRVQEQSVTNAQDAVKWWESVDGPHMLLSAELGTRQTRYSVEDQDDELDQLKQMYKTEDLTTATADIVIKRALRRLEITQQHLKISEANLEKTKTYAYSIAQQRVLDGLVREQQALSALRATQEQARVTRAAALTAARVAAAQAEEKLADLKHDVALFRFVAPADGVVWYEQVPEAAPGEERRGLRAEDRVTAGAVMMRLIGSGKFKVDATLTEAQAFHVEKGMKATVTPAAFAWTSFPASTGAVVGGIKSNNAFAFSIPVVLNGTDPRLLPGMKASVRIEAGKVEDALLIPVAAVKVGGVTVKGKDGKAEQRKVELGKSDGKSIVVTSGLSEGDEVIEGVGQ